MLFTFARHEVSNPDTGKEVVCWLPFPETDPASWPGPSFAEANPHLIDIELEGERRVALRTMVTMAMLYNAQFERRIQLGHDCGVFALSCESGDPLSEKFFTKSKRDKVRTANMGEPRPIDGDTFSAEPAANAGRALFLVDRAMTEAHIVVQATADDDEPLYLSKIGTEGPVVLTDLEHVANLYESELASVVSGFSPA